MVTFRAEAVPWSGLRGGAGGFEALALGGSGTSTSVG